MRDSDISDSAYEKTCIEMMDTGLKNGAMRRCNMMAVATLAALLNGVSEGCHAADTFPALALKNTEQSSAVQPLFLSRNSAGQSFSKGLSGQSFATVDRLSDSDQPRAALKSSGQANDPRYETNLPGFGKADNLMRPKTLEDIARRFHREGLPIARLWQTDSTALSLGLNNRGKPGLWFVKKLP